MSAEQFRRDPLRLLPRQRRRARSLQGRPIRFPRRELRRRTGRPPTTSRPASRARWWSTPIRSAIQALMQGFAFNTRREKFQDPRLRRAFDLVMNFEEMNRRCSTTSTRASTSYFENTELASSGLPQGKELEILNTVRERGAAGGLHHAPISIRSSGDTNGPAREPARGGAASRRGRLDGEKRRRKAGA